MTAGGPRRVWIDLTNSPHVLFFRPILRRLEEAGFDTVVTARDFAQTLELLHMYGIPHTVIGRHAGSRLARKGIGFARRALGLARFGRSQGRITQAVSHGSTELAVATRLLGIHHTLLHDFEEATVMHRLNFKLADKVMMPSVVPQARLGALGLDLRRYQPYAGIKEQVSLADFEPDPTVLDQLGLDRGRVVAVLRPPATMSLYHRFESPLFLEVLEYLVDQGVQVVLLPRTPEQRREFAETRGIVFPSRVIDGPSLVYAADIVISGGGTMNREAAILGTPTWTTFAGRMGAVDRMLIDTGRMRFLERVGDLEIRKHIQAPPRFDALADEVTAEILRR